MLEANGLDESRVLDIAVGDGGTLLPRPVAFTGYLVDIGDEALTFYNDKLNVKTALPYADFQSAEFGIGSGNLWLQCVVRGSSLVFCMPRKSWKSDKAKRLIDKISSATEIRDMKEFEHYTGKFFFIYMFK